MSRRVLAVAVLVITVAAVLASPLRASPSKGAQKWAVVAGIDDYAGGTHDLVGGAGDVDDMVAMLLKTGWPRDHILVLRDRAATGAAIRSGFQWLAARATPTSHSVFHYSGHVKQINGDPDRDGEALDEYLWGADNNLISDAELGAAMRAIKGWLWVNIAGCEAGGLDDGISSTGRLFTGSSQESEKSYENPQWRNSVYVHYMAEEAVLNGKGDYNRDGVVSLTEAFRMAHEQAPRLTHTQSKGPQHPYARGGDGTEWFFDGPPAPPPPPPTTTPPPAEEEACHSVICIGLLGLLDK